MANSIDEIKSLFTKICTNSCSTIAVDDNGKITRQLYMRSDLAAWSQEFYDKHKPCFYYEPVDPNNKYGKLRLCEPKYEYVLSRGLTIEEYELLFPDTKEE